MQVVTAILLKEELIKQNNSLTINTKFGNVMLYSVT